MQSKVDDFLLKYGLHPDLIDIDFESGRIAAEMMSALCGEVNSMLMLPTYLTVDGSIPKGRKVIVIDAGGTNFRVAVVSFEDAPVTHYFKKYSMPGSEGAITRGEFFKTIVDRLEPVISESDDIGFCYSYVAVIKPSRDALAQELSKEVDVIGIKGTMLGESINRELLSRGHKPKNIVVLNDTVAAMMGAKAIATKDYESYMGYILGTGLNICYSELAANITKEPEAAAFLGNMVINTECAGYDKLPQGIIDREIDATTKNVGTWLLEKMISGAYIGQIMQKALEYAAKEGLFSENCKKRIDSIVDFSIVDVNNFLDDRATCDIFQTESDEATATEIFSKIFERSAKITTIIFLSVLKKTNQGSCMVRPVCICAEGTTFHKSNVFKAFLEKYIDNDINNAYNRYVEIVRAENPTITGTAVAALLNIK